jgi:hypothetical protein
MHGYAVRARLDHGEPRVVAWAGPDIDTMAAADGPDVDELEPIDLVGTPFGERFTDWVIGVREAWSQTVFYVFDPESWR